MTANNKTSGHPDPGAHTLISSAPELSVIVVVLAGGTHLVRCLEALRDQTDVPGGIGSDRRTLRHSARGPIARAPFSRSEIP